MPDRHRHLAQAELLIDEVEVVLHARAGDRLEQRFPARFVLPGAIGGTCLHGGEDMYRTEMVAALGEDGLDSILLAERLELADELDLKSSLGGQSLGVGAHFIAQRLGPAGVIEQAAAAVSQVTGHRSGMADPAGSG